MNKKIYLYIEYWKCFNEVRDKELIDSIQKNIDSKFFDKIYIFCDNEEPNVSKFENINIIKCDRKKVKEILSFVNQVSDENTINVISNTDIIFDETIKLIYNIRKNELYALTRYEADGKIHNNSSEFGTSQDCWIFAKKFLGNLSDYDFYMGYPGVDGKIAYLSAQYYQIKNPCKSIKIHHNHKSDIRTGHSNQDIAIITIPRPHLFILKTHINDEFCYTHYMIYDEHYRHLRLSKKPKHKID